MDLVSGLRFVLALLVVLGLIAALAWILRRYGAGRVTLGAGKGRLGVVEASHIDAKRRLVLIRRDGVEHLLLLGPTTEMVIETGIENPVQTGATPGTGFAAHLDTTQNPDGGAGQ